VKKKSFRYKISIILFLFFLLTSFGFAQIKDKKGSLPLEDLRIFAEVFDRIKQGYVEPVDDKELLRFAIQGMLRGLDPHSAFLENDAFDEMRDGAKGEFGGLGIEVGIEDGNIKVIAPIDDTPAQAAGIKAGDIIIRIDKKSLKDSSLQDAVKLMRGKPGSKVKLSIARKGEIKPIEITIVRAVIKTQSVKYEMLDQSFAYIRLSQFQARSVEEVLSATNKLKSDAGGKLNGLILDLRNNPGGVLNAAVAISDAFLSDGTIVYTEGRLPDSQLVFTAAPDDILDGAPIVVLIDRGSASASEIVAGALQDHKRAVIMGEKTFGKGSVQTIVPVNNTAAIKLTTARYFTPNGKSIQAEGILPDIEVKNLTLKDSNPHRVRISESDLPGHLQNSNKKNTKFDPKKEKDTSLAEKDYVLNEALNLLKGLVILGRSSD
tara:strand:+ start:30385 stop:31683 length:1299 start_codon:yes stop_codon:yes gene_type:complete